MKRSFALICLLAVTALTACATRSLATQAPAMPDVRQPQSFAGSGGAAPQPSLSDANKAVGQSLPEAPVPGAPPQVANGPAVDETNRLVIQNADLSIVVADVNARVKAIEDMAKVMGGFIVSVNVSQTYANDGSQVPQAQIVVRVPSDKLEQALLQIKQNTVDVQNENRTGTDVTDQYVDLQSRLKAKQAAEAQLLTIMQNATKTQDVLDVYSQLQQIQSDIEVLKGQIKYYEQSAALSAISINVIAEKTVKPIEVGGWKPQGVARDAIQQLVFFWQDFINFLIKFFLLILPVLITIAIPLYLAFLLLRSILRRTRKPRTIAPADAPK